MLQFVADPCWFWTCVVYQLVSSKQIQALSFVQLCDGWQRRRPYTRVVSVFLGGWFWGKTHRILGDFRVITLGFTWRSAESGKVWCIYIYTYTQVRWNIDRIIGSSPPSWDRFISKKEGMTIAGLFWVLWSLCFHSWGYADSAFHAAWVKNIGQLVLCYSPRKLRLSPWKRKNTAIWQNFERIVFKAIIFFQGNDIFSFSQEVNQQIQSTSLVTSAGGRLLHLWHLLLL